MPPVTRRGFLKIGAAAGSLGAIPYRGRGQAAGSYLESRPDMLVQYLSSRLNVLAAQWDGERARIRTAGDLERRSRFVREKVLDMLGGLPERGPLDPVVVRTRQRSGYRVENVLYRSRPNFPVTGNLYIPEGTGPFPAVLSPCGHYPLARMYRDYQAAYVNLARAGFVVLAYDPIGQGERRQYWDPATGVSEIPDSLYEHEIPGHLLLLLGENLAQYFIWDGIRGIDYLLTRPEVDAERIGCAGHSGGSTLTLFIALVDDRVKCAVMNENSPGNWWPVNIPIRERLPARDAEQNICPAALYGIDRLDMAAAIAPRPLLNTTEQYGAVFRDMAGRIRARYRLLAADEKFAIAEAGDPHAWTMKLRLATTDWFSRWFHGRSGPTQEPEFEPEKPETLYATASGSVLRAHQGDTIFSLLSKKQSSLPLRLTPAGAAEIAEVLHFRHGNGPLGVRQLFTTRRKGYRVEKLEFVSEPGIYIPTWVFVPERRTSRGATIFADEAGLESEAMEFGLYEMLARKGRLTIALDVRGIGQTRPRHPQESTGAGPFERVAGVETALSYMAWQLGESLFGMRVQDLVRGVDYVLGRRDVEPGDVRVCGRGAGALLAIYAAALDTRISAVIAERGLLSYRTLAQADRYTHGTGIFLRGVLQRFDLPHIAAAIAPRPLTLAGPVDAMERPVTEETARDAYQITTETYRALGKQEFFRIASTADMAWYAG